MFENLLVIELAGVLAGPSVGMFLAELGARAIKVENPAKDGDVTRHWKLPAESADTDISAYFSAVNWGKESLCLDLTQEAGREIIYQLAEKADIVLSSLVPGSAARLSLDADRLLAINPRLICAEIRRISSACRF